MSQAALTCSQRMALARFAGRIVVQDTIDRLSTKMAQSGRVYFRIVKPTPALVQQLTSAKGVTAVRQPQADSFEVDTDGTKDTAAGLAAQIVSSGAGLVEMRQESFNLEDVFLKLTTSEEQQGVSV